MKGPESAHRGRSSEGNTHVLTAGCTGCLVWPVGWGLIVVAGLRLGSGGLDDYRSWIPWLVLCLLGTGVAAAMSRGRPWPAALPPLLAANVAAWVLSRGVGALGPTDSTALARMLVLSGLMPCVALLGLISLYRHTRRPRPGDDDGI